MRGSPPFSPAPRVVLPHLQKDGRHRPRMAQLDLPATLMPSLKDRLLDPESMGTRGRPGYSMRQILDSVREDLEELLNTRRSFQVLETQYAEVPRSIVTYGLPDVTSLVASTPAPQSAI